jgi:hypothetical protein
VWKDGKAEGGARRAVYLAENAGSSHRKFEALIPSNPGPALFTPSPINPAPSCAGTRFLRRLLAFRHRPRVGLQPRRQILCSGYSSVRVSRLCNGGIRANNTSEDRTNARHRPRPPNLLRIPPGAFQPASGPTSDSRPRYRRTPSTSQRSMALAAACRNCPDPSCAPAGLVRSITQLPPISLTPYGPLRDESWLETRFLHRWTIACHGDRSMCIQCIARRGSLHVAQIYCERALGVHTQMQDARNSGASKPPESLPRLPPGTAERHREPSPHAAISGGGAQPAPIRGARRRPAQPSMRARHDQPSTRHPSRQRARRAAHGRHPTRSA